MTGELDLTTLTWELTGWRPLAWRLSRSIETSGFLAPDHGPVPGRLPGSVQASLLAAGRVSDWHDGLGSAAIEWVEHRHWRWAAAIDLPAAVATVTLAAECLDTPGWVLWNDRVVAIFDGDPTPGGWQWEVGCRPPGGHRLALVFGQPPEEPGQLGHTSQVRTLKARYHYGWDWCPRVVSIGAAGALALRWGAGAAYGEPVLAVALSPDAERGEVTWHWPAAPGDATEHVEATLSRGGAVVAREIVARGAEGARGCLRVVQPERWWPRGTGEPNLYQVELRVCRATTELRRWRGEVGFKHVRWEPCEGAPAAALPWVAVVNDHPLFLQGVNWTPVRMCPPDVTPAEVHGLVARYRELGCNLLRVWGGAGIESRRFYEACDRAGLLVWQEFPLCSSGLDSEPPRDEDFGVRLTRLARAAVRRRRHHACLLQWGGGNELARHPAQGQRQPLGLDHPVLARLAAVVAEEDPRHRFVPTSPCGPRFHSTRAEFGHGVHHNVHGPWGRAGFADFESWKSYWEDDDALFRAETGVAGASRPDLVARHAAGWSPWPPDNPWWRHSSAWWAPPAPAVAADQDPVAAFADFAASSRAEQATYLAAAAAAKRAQFPRCGGFLVWMGHDAFPCLANTSLIEFDHEPKPAFYALAEVFHRPLVRAPRHAPPPSPVAPTTS